MLEATGLHRSFGATRALDGFDLAIAPGEVVGLIGPNGAGKSTFDRVVAGLLRPDRGRVVVAGIDVGRDPRRARALLGMAAQEPAVYPTATVRENLRLFGGLAGLGRQALRAALDRTCAELLLTDVADQPVGTLSGGQRRRVHAAAAMLHRPALLLLDEPTVGADPVTRDALLHAVRSRAAAGAAVCYTTHYLPELEVLDATVAVAVAGRVVARGDRTMVLAQAGVADLEKLFRLWVAEAGQVRRAG
jgi:ABC-2 type transport system ATP-binding protein